MWKKGLFFSKSFTKGQSIKKSYSFIHVIFYYVDVYPVVIAYALKLKVNADFKISAHADITQHLRLLKYWSLKSTEVEFNHLWTDVQQGKTKVVQTQKNCHIFVTVVKLCVGEQDRPGWLFNIWHCGIFFCP